MPTNAPITERMISDFCRKRVPPHLLPAHTEALRKFLIASVDTGVGVPRYAGKYDWTAMGMLTNVPAEMLIGAPCRQPCHRRLGPNGAVPPYRCRAIRGAPALHCAGASV